MAKGRKEHYRLKFFLTLILLALLLAGAAGFLLYVPYGPNAETFVDIPPGASLHTIAIKLQSAGVLRSRYAFALLRMQKGGTLKAGEYRFDHPALPAEIYDRMARGDVYTIALTIPEGYNIFDIALAVESAHLGFPAITAATFLAAERSHPELINAWTTPGALPPASLEGYLFPDTYHFSRHATPVQILTAMVHRFRQATTQLGLIDDVPRTIIMASLIEKEVREDSERPLVAGVFVNRLARSMPLATDPSVIYAALLDNRWRGTIYASDLQSPSPYNTYRNPGLPPGPICNPGVASIRAAMHPAATDYLYFVSDAAGHTRFSVDLKEHAAQVQDYRNAQQSR
jgi:UPF0755 protein